MATVVGDKSGYLVVVELNVGSHRQGHAIHKFLCTGCGKYVNRRADKFQAGLIKSCGCVKEKLNAEYEKRRRLKIVARMSELDLREIEKQAILEGLKEQEKKWDPANRKERLFKMDSFEKRHDSLKAALFYLDISRDDPLWNFRYYIELVRDGECYYCKAELDLGWHALDCKIDVLDIQAFNVVPACKACIARRHSVPGELSFEEMELLGPTLELIRLQRECNESPMQK